MIEPTKDSNASYGSYGTPSTEELDKIIEEQIAKDIEKGIITDMINDTQEDIKKFEELLEEE